MFDVVTILFVVRTILSVQHVPLSNHFYHLIIDVLHNSMPFYDS